jgi:hypothetical protein
VVQALAEALTEHCVFTSGGVWADRRAAGVADIDERRNRGIGEGRHLAQGRAAGVAGAGESRPRGRAAANATQGAFVGVAQHRLALMGCRLPCLRPWPASEPGSWESKTTRQPGSGET